MKELTFYPLARTPALVAACMYLEERGIRVSDRADASVTHLLLPIPKFDTEELDRLHSRLDDDITFVGGNLSKGIDLLKDARYLAENAAITADCAIRLAGQGLKTVFRDLPILVIGWGRIGKCLAAQLRGLGADVTVSARKDADRAMLAALGYQAIPIEGLETCLPRYRIVFNTVPSEVISQQQVRRCRPLAAPLRCRAPLRRQSARRICRGACSVGSASATMSATRSVLSLTLTVNTASPRP